MSSILCTPDETVMDEPSISVFDDEMVELSLLLPGWQAAALEEIAHGRGLTVGQLVRRLIREFTSGRD